MPRVLDRAVFHRHEGHALVDRLASLVDHRNAHHCPVGVQAAAGPGPLACHQQTSVDALGGCQGRKHAGDTGFRILAPNVVLTLGRRQPGEESANIHQGRSPRRRPASFGQGRRHIHLGVDVRFQAAEAARHHHLEDSRFAHGRDVLLHHAAVHFCLSGVRLQQRTQSAGALHQHRAQGFRIEMRDVADVDRSGLNDGLQKHRPLLFSRPGSCVVADEGSSCLSHVSLLKVVYSRCVGSFCVLVMLEKHGAGTSKLPARQQRTGVSCCNLLPQQVGDGKPFEQLHTV